MRPSLRSSRIGTPRRGRAFHRRRRTDIDQRRHWTGPRRPERPGRATGPSRVAGRDRPRRFHGSGDRRIGGDLAHSRTRFVARRRAGAGPGGGSFHALHARAAKPPTAPPFRADRALGAGWIINLGAIGGKLTFPSAGAHHALQTWGRGPVPSLAFRDRRLRDQGHGDRAGPDHHRLIGTHGQARLGWASGRDASYRSAAAIHSRSASARRSAMRCRRFVNSDTATGPLA